MPYYVPEVSFAAGNAEQIECTLLSVPGPPELSHATHISVWCHLMTGMVNGSSKAACDIMVSSVLEWVLT